MDFQFGRLLHEGSLVIFCFSRLFARPPRLWGYVNSLELRVWFRPTGYRVYAWIFGCNLNEIEPSDLRTYKSLGDFFYRGLQPGAGPIVNSALVSPADRTVIHFGVIDNHQIEQVKGVTYSVDALLGIPSSKPAQEVEFSARETADVDNDEFANVNGIDYSLVQLLGHTALEDTEAEAMEEGTSSRPDSPNPIKDVTTAPKDSATTCRRPLKSPLPLAPSQCRR